MENMEVKIIDAGDRNFLTCVFSNCPFGFFFFLGKGGNIFNLTCFVQILKWKGRKGEGSKTPSHRLIYCFS